MINEHYSKLRIFLLLLWVHSLCLGMQQDDKSIVLLSQKRNTQANLLSLYNDLWLLICGQIDNSAQKNLRLVCKNFAQTVVLPETDGLQMYRALNALCENDSTQLESLRAKKIQLKPYRWLTDLNPGNRLIKKDDVRYTSWKKLAKECGCYSPYGVGNADKREDSGKISIIEFGSTIEESKAKTAIHTRKIEYSFFDKPFRLIAACLLGKHEQVKEIMIEHCAAQGLTKKEKDVIIPAFAIAVHNNDIKTLTVFCDVVKDIKKQHKFYFVHMFLLNIALAKNKKEAFDLLSSLVLHGNPQEFITPLDLRSKIERHWADLRDAHKSEDEVTQDLYDFMTNLGFNISDKKDVRQTALYYKGNAKWGNTNAFAYGMYLSAMANYINVDRKGRGWETEVELFKIQDNRHLQDKINTPILRAIKNNDLELLQNMLNDLEKQQYFYDEKRKVALFDMHIEWLKEAKRCKNKNAFYALKPFEFCFDGSERYCTRRISKWATARDTIDYSEEATDFENVLMNDELAISTSPATKSFFYIFTFFAKKIMSWWFI